MSGIKEVLEYFPYDVQKKIRECGHNLDNLEEIRVRTNRNLLLKIGQVEYEVNYSISTQEVLEILQRICDNSIYTYQNQICNGYITIKGGHRVRYLGKCSAKRGTSVKHILHIQFKF